MEATTTDPAGVGEAGTRLAVRRLVVGYRAVGAVWLAVLGAVLLSGGGPPRPVVVVATVACVLAWTASTAAVGARAPHRWRSPAWLVADIGVAAWTVAAPWAAGVAVGFAGGYPFSAVLLGVAARGLPGGAAAAGVLSAVAVARLAAQGAAALTEVVGQVLFWVLATAVLVWGQQVLRRAETSRLAIERDLAEERGERRRSQERAETAAHLHDSVLQTLALIQRRSGDPAAVTALARRQERELRAWLHQPAGGDDDGLRAGVERIAAEVERDHTVTVEWVAVGDARGPAVTALVAAAREALVNAAKHAGVDHVDVYAEADGRTARVFVRDRGAGFDPADVGADRQGVTRSIVGRMERQGGTARISSAPGKGTEVELSLPLETGHRPATLS